MISIQKPIPWPYKQNIEIHSPIYTVEISQIAQTEPYNEHKQNLTTSTNKTLQQSIGTPSSEKYNSTQRTFIAFPKLSNIVIQQSKNYMGSIPTI